MLDGGNLPMLVQPALPPEPERDTTAEAITIWRSSGPITGSPAEAYLRGRGLDLRLPESLRFARLRYGSKTLPCLVALIANGQDKIGGIQRTFVREDGTGKADVPAAKLSLGRISGGAIRLAPAAGTLIVTGGLEDGLTLLQELGQAVWAATGEGNMANIVLPIGVKSVVIGADRDDSGEAHASRAAEAFTLQGRSVRIIRPMPGFNDFNSELQGIPS
jgi:DNA primase